MCPAYPLATCVLLAQRIMMRFDSILHPFLCPPSTLFLSPSLPPSVPPSLRPSLPPSLPPSLALSLSLSPLSLLFISFPPPKMLPSEVSGSDVQRSEGSFWTMPGQVPPKPQTVQRSRHAVYSLVDLVGAGLCKPSLAI